MCGIIGYKGREDAAPLLLEGLRRLEYRGYDSAGMAVAGNPSLQVKKGVGEIDKLHERRDFLSMEGENGIAHTRWATHGEVKPHNSHPHTSSNGDIAVVHNGIIENFHELRKELKEKGYSFYSDTDTEIIPKLIEDVMNEGEEFSEASKKALERLEGRYAIVALHKDGRMVASRKGSPLVIGVGEDEYFAASDIPAFMEHTKDVIYLHDHDFVVIDDDLSIRNLEKGEEVRREIDTIDWDEDRADKGDFRHYMLKEIMEQTDVLERETERDGEPITRLANDIRNTEAVVLVASGTSAHACEAGCLLLSKIARKQVTSIRSAQFSSLEHLVGEDTLVVAVSQSGETADTLEAVEKSREKGANIVSIVNVPESTLDRKSEYTILTEAGPEIGVASTKAYTSQLSVLTLLAYELADNLDEGREKLNFVKNQAYHLTAASTRNHLEELAEKLQEHEHIFTIGRGLQMGTAKEAALKIKEISYIHTEAFHAGELKHGTLALIEEGTPCLVFFSEEDKRETISNAQEIKARGGYIIGVGPENDPTFDYFIKVHESERCNPILQIIPMQILAYQLALLRGHDPDKPRNLAKSVTVK